MVQFKRGTKLATGSALEINLGFVPDTFYIMNPLRGMSMKWNRTMGTTITGVKSGGKYLLASIVKATRASIGSTPANVASTAFDFAIAGVNYTKAAVTAGTAPTATTVPQNKWGLFGFEIGADGTIDKKDAADNATGYTTEALAIAALPTASASHVLAFYITVMSVNAAGFVGATDSLATGGDVTAHYYNVNPWNILVSSTLGISELDDGTSRGVNVGTDTDINVSGETLYYEAMGCI